MSGTDVGRTAVGAAEDAAFGGTDLDVEVPLDELVALAARITGGAWWAACAAPAVRVGPARADAMSSTARTAAGLVRVTIAAGQRTPGTVTHELAHALAGIAQGHDGRFRAAHVDLVALVASSSAGRALRETYRLAGVPVGVRTWPPPFRAVGEGFVVVP